MAWLFRRCFGLGLPGPPEPSCEPEKTHVLIPQSPDETGRVGKFSDECVICLCGFRGTKGITLPCGHAFHTECIMQWWEYNQHCPICMSDQRL